MAKQMTPLPDAKSVRVNPSADELKQLAAKMPNARETRYGNLNVQTEVLARSKASTFLVLDDPDGSSQQAISRDEGERIAKLQDEYIAACDMVVVDGFIGDDPEFRTPARLYIEESNANIAGMQRQLYFDVDDPDGFEPQLTVIYTPNLAVEGYPNDRVITVDLERGVTRVCNSDYFGEPKKGGLPPGLQLGLLGRGEEGRAADGEQARLRPRRAAAARRLQGHPDARRRQGRPDRRPEREGPAHHHLPQA